VNTLVSVIVPCYNQAQYLSEALQSVLGQTITNWECIIVNDGSSDNTEFIASTWCKKDNRFQYLKKENGGLASARNEGIKVAKGKYILPLDADDKIGSRYLEEAAKILNKDREIGIVYCNVEFFGEKTGKWKLPDFSIDGILIMNMIICTALFRRSDFLETKGFDPNMKYGWEDWDLWLSLIENGKGVYKLPGVHFYYRIKNKNSMLQDLSLRPEKYRYSLKTIYLNHFDLYLSKQGNPIELYSKLNKVLLSKDYRIGRFIINPLRKLRYWIKTN
jgi:glycosyltransferase involved in cell wall biosynthesis